MDKPNEIKACLEAAISDVLSARGEYIADLSAFSRNSVFGASRLIHFMLGMDGGSIARELHKAKIEVTPSAFVQNRRKIAAAAFRDIMRNFNSYCQDEKNFRGYRLLAVDGTNINLPYNPAADSFVKVPTNPKGGYNALHANCCFDLLNYTYYDNEMGADEQGALIKMLYRNRFTDKTLIIGDRGYESYNVIAHLYNVPNVDFLIRVKQDRSAMREIGKLPMMELDKHVGFVLTRTQTNEDKAQNRIYLPTGSRKGKINSPKTRITRFDFPTPCMMAVRVVRFMLDTGEYETLITSLDRSFGIAELKALYHLRWSEEISFRFLKYGICLENLHGKSDMFAEQEFYSALTMYNFCNRISREVVIRKKESNIYEYRVNLTMAIQLCKEFFRTPNADGEKLMRDIARYTEPVRPGRRDERNMKAKSFVGFTYRVAA